MPFNDSDWFCKDDDVRLQYGVPPRGNANFAWVQHFIHHLASRGMAGFVLANGSMSSNQSCEGTIRQAIIGRPRRLHVALPGQLFYKREIPVCLWFLSKNKSRRVLQQGEDSPNCARLKRRQALKNMGALNNRRNRKRVGEDNNPISLE